MSTQRRPQPEEKPDRAGHQEGIGQEGIGGVSRGGGSHPVRERGARRSGETRQRAVPPLVIAANLVALAVPLLWIMGYVAGGAPAQAFFVPVLLLVLVVGGATGYWLLRRSG